MKEKKPLTIKQQKNKYRFLQWLAFGGEFVAVSTPYIVMGAINYEEWFLTNPNGWQVGLGGSIAMALMGIIIAVITFKKENDNKITDGYVSLILVWLVFATCLHLLGDIIYEISKIMYFGAIGLAGAFGLNLTSKAMQNKADLYKKAMTDATAELNKEQAKEEVKEEKVKVRVK